MPALVLFQLGLTIFVVIFRSLITRALASTPLRLLAKLSICHIFTLYFIHFKAR